MPPAAADVLQEGSEGGPGGLVDAAAPQGLGREYRQLIVGHCMKKTWPNVADDGP